jgi:hypothetical protein
MIALRYDDRGGMSTDTCKFVSVKALRRFFGIVWRIKSG